MSASKLGPMAQEAFERAKHPLDLNGIANVARLMIWDGDIEGAAALIAQGYECESGHSPNYVTAFYTLIGMSSAINAELGRRNHERQARKDRADVRKFRPRVRREVRP